MPPFPGKTMNVVPLQWYQTARIGEASNPGPNEGYNATHNIECTNDNESDAKSDVITISSVNVTSADLHDLEIIDTVVPDEYVFMQETKLPTCKQHAFNTKAKLKRVKALLTPSVPNKDGISGGEES